MHPPLVTAATVTLSKLWKSRDITGFPSKVKFERALVPFIFLYGCGSWNLTTATEKKIPVFRMKCFRRLLRISWTERRTDDSIQI